MEREQAADIFILEENYWAAEEERLAVPIREMAVL